MTAGSPVMRFLRSITRGTSSALVVLGLASLVTPAAAEAQDGWTYKGFRQGMSTSDVVAHLNQLGYSGDNCSGSIVCSAIRRRGDDAEILSFRFCGIGGSLKDMWISLDGGSVLTIADALDEFRAQYGADVIKVQPHRTTSQFEGATIHRTAILFLLSSPITVEQGWGLTLSISGRDENQQYPGLDTQVYYHSSCD